MSVLAADFGPLVIETDVDTAVLTLLARWIPTYLARFEEERGWANRLVARPVKDSYSSYLEDEEFPDYRMPSVLATTSRPDETVRNGDSLWSVGYGVTVSCVVRGRTPGEARMVAAVFGGAVRRALTQQDTGLASEVRWTGGPGVSPVATSTGETRHLAASVNTFIVYVDDVLQGAPAGPYLPSPDEPSTPYTPPDPDGNPDAPYQSLADATSMTVDVQGVPITDQPGG